MKQLSCWGKIHSVVEELVEREQATPRFLGGLFCCIHALIDKASQMQRHSHLLGVLFFSVNDHHGIAANADSLFGWIVNNRGCPTLNPLATISDMCSLMGLLLSHPYST